MQNFGSNADLSLRTPAKTQITNFTVTIQYYDPNHNGHAAIPAVALPLRTPWYAAIANASAARPRATDPHGHAATGHLGKGDQNNKNGKSSDNSQNSVWTYQRAGIVPG